MHRLVGAKPRGTLDAVPLRIPSRLTVLTAALVVLLPTLAVLQYQWAGQLRDAERERMERNMRNAAAQFRDAFDHEIARAFVGLQVDGAIAREAAWDRYAERYSAWLNTAAHPAVVANVYLIDSIEERARLRRWSVPSRTFEAAQWEGALESTRAHFEQDLAAHRSGAALAERERLMFKGDESLLVAPIINGGVHVRLLTSDDAPASPLFAHFGYTVVQLNMPFIREQLLPLLAERHFTHTGDAAYRAAIIDAADPRRIIFRTSADAPTDPARADASQALFGIQGSPLMLFARGPLRELPRLSASDGHDPGRHNVFVSVIRERRGPGENVRAQVVGDTGRWRLLLQHERGSLEAAVTSVRQRNLAVSFGILLLMGVSIGLLAVSSRRAQRLARQQMEFVAGVSHELRTPVAVIRSAAENLSHGVVGDPGRVRRYGDAIQVEARRLGDMVERVLQFAGIESGRLTARSPVELPAVVETAIATALAGDEHITIERHVAPGLPAVLGDPDALRSAVHNLIVNAAKYGGADRWIGVRVDVHGTGRRREVRIAVEDRGPGVAATDLPHIFEPFYRGADALARQVQGSGLGLALVRRIAEAHGGRVTVTSGPGGSVFTIHLPAFRLKPEATSEHRDDTAPIGSQASPRRV
jgi:signal transduction histidine kinase